jgi:hypothetical protein
MARLRRVAFQNLLIKQLPIDHRRTDLAARQRNLWSGLLLLKTNPSIRFVTSLLVDKLTSGVVRPKF